MIWFVAAALQSAALFVWGLIGYRLARRSDIRLAATREEHRRQYREQARIYAETVNRVGESMTGAVQAAKAREAELTAECERLTADVSKLATENAMLRGTYRREVARG